MFSRGILALCAIFLCACGGQVVNKEVAYSGKVIELSDSLSVLEYADTIDLGRIREGEVISHQLMLCNKSDRVLVVLGVETSCGCTKVDIPRQPMKPLEQAALSFEFDSKGMNGWQIKTINIQTSLGSCRRKLVVVAMVD